MVSGATRRFPRWMRLKARHEFVQVRQAGRRLARGCLIANCLECPGAGKSRLGVVVGSNVGKAVARNRSRRLLREVFRLHQSDLLKPVSLVLVARPSIAGKTLAEVESDFLAAVRKMGLLKQES